MEREREFGGEQRQNRGEWESAIVGARGWEGLAIGIKGDFGVGVGV